MAIFGMHLGTAFQIIDDVLDYSADEAETGKHLGDDLAEGKTILPLIHAIQHGSPEQVERVRHAIENGGREDFPVVLEAIQATRALDFTRDYARVEADLAITALQPLPASIFKDTLLELAGFAVARSF
jgi:octaprenyl-diphosphate synthase